MSRRLIAVVTCGKYSYPDEVSGGHKSGENNLRANAVRQTWYREWLCRYADSVDLKFFLGRCDRSPQENEIFLDCGDSYYGLPEKVRKTYDWAYRAGYDFVAKTDDDVFVHMGRMLANLSDDDYRGFAIESDIRYASGTCYWLSRRAMKLVADAEIPKGEWREDLHCGRVLLNNGIQLVNDERFLCCSCDICLAKYKDSISIHTTQAGQMFTLMETSHG